MLNYQSLALVVLTLLLAACGGAGHKTAEAGTAADTTEVLIDSTKLPSPNVDNLFNDFLYEFMNNPTFQLTRVKFPLTYAGHSFVQSTWKHDSIFANESHYVVLCSDIKDMSLEKATDLNTATVYRLYSQQNKVRHYTFVRNESQQWLLTALADEPLSAMDKDGFYEFYTRFATDLDYQKEHLAAEIKYSYFNEEIQVVENGFITADQWQANLPELPATDFSTIYYGQSALEGKYRYLMIRGLSNGLASTITFERKGNAWYVVGLEH